MRCHEEKIPCPECGKLVKDINQHNLISHTPDEEKPFQCPDCDRGFINQDQLKKHRISVHLKTRPYKCRYGCTFAYIDPSNRNAHERKSHGKLYLNRTEEKEKNKIYVE